MINRLIPSNALSLTEEANYLKEMDEWEDNQVVQFLERHPEAMLMAAKTIDCRPHLIPQLKQAKNEVYLGLFETKKREFFARSDEHKCEKYEWVLKNSKLMKKNPFLSELLCLTILKENPFCLNMIEKQTEAMVLEAYNATDLEAIHDWTPTLARLAIVKTPEVIASIPNATEELKELAIMLKPSVIQSIPQPSDKLIELAFQLDPYLLNRFETISEEIAWRLSTTHHVSLSKVKNPSESFCRYAVFKDYTCFKDVENPSESLCWLALYRSNGEALRWMENPTEEMIDFVLNLNASAIKYLQNAKPHHYEKALSLNLYSLHYSKKANSSFFEMAVRVAHQKDEMESNDFSTLAGYLPHSFAELCESIKTLSQLAQKHQFEGRIPIPSAIPEWQFQQLLTKFPRFLKPDSSSSFSNEEINTLALEDAQVLDFYDVCSCEEPNWILQHLLAGECLIKSVGNLVQESPLHEKMLQLIENEGIQIPKRPLVGFEEDPSKGWKLIQANPFNLAIIPMRYRSFSLCRQAKKLNPDTRIFSPFHLNEFIEESRLMNKVSEWKEQVREFEDDLPF